MPNSKTPKNLRIDSPETIALMDTLVENLNSTVLKHNDVHLSRNTPRLYWIEGCRGEPHVTPEFNQPASLNIDCQISRIDTCQTNPVWVVENSYFKRVEYTPLQFTEQQSGFKFTESLFELLVSKELDNYGGMHHKVSQKTIVGRYTQATDVVELQTQQNSKEIPIYSPVDLRKFLGRAASTLTLN